MFKWLKDRWNYLVGKNVEKQEEQFSPIGNYTYTISVSPATTTDGKEHSDAGSVGGSTPYTEESDPVGWHNEDLESIFGDPKPKKKSKNKSKNKKKSKKKGKKK
jgi:hypothetical protein